jgi:hypothetical protein
MKRNVASARAAFRRCSPSALRLASSAAVLALVLAACGSAAVSPSASATLSPSASSSAPGVKSVPFSEVATTQRANYDGDADVIVGSSSAARAEILRRANVATAPSSGVLIGVFQGEQRTGGHGVQIAKIERIGDELVVTATFTLPPAGGFVTQVITSPAHLVSITTGDLAGAKTAVLLDASGAERARVSVP